MFKTWAEVPDKPTAELVGMRWFLEIYSGKGWLTRAMRRRGWAVLPLVDIVIEGEVLAAASVLDVALMAKITAWITAGAVKLVSSAPRARRSHVPGGMTVVRRPSDLTNT